MAGKMIWLGGAAPRALAAAAGGFLLAQAAATVPVLAAACTGAVDTANSTVCAPGASVVGLTYVDSNPVYVSGNFQLTLDNHDVTADGIVFSGTVNGDGVILLQNGSDVTNAGGDGINASADTAGEDLTITVESGSTVTGTTNGINALSENGNVAVTMEAGTTVTGSDGAVGRGIQAQALGAVTVTARGNVKGTIDGIFAQSEVGAAAVTTGDQSLIEGGNDGISAQSTNGGTVTITTGQGSQLVGTNDIGIEAGIINGGAITVTTGDNSRTRGGTEGIQAVGFAAGNITVSTGVDSDVEGGSGDGIDATSFADGIIEVTTGASSGVSGGDNGNGIQAASASGNVFVTTGQSSETTGGVNGIGASTGAGGVIGILNNGTVAGTHAGIEAVSGVGVIQITNHGGIANTSLRLNDLAIRTAGGSATIGNAGTIIGRIETGGSADRLDNDGEWLTVGISDFGGGTDAVNNNKTLFVGIDDAAGEIATFVGLETLTNSGEIVLADQFGSGGNISDRLELSNDYVGQGGARILVDAFLSGPGSVADVLFVGGNTSGVTSIAVFDSNLGGPGAFNPTGILVVDVAGTANAGDFVLANGPIDKGLFVYDLVFNNTNQANDQFLLVSAADEEVFETLATVASSQEIWRETAAAWEGRQQVVRDRIARGVLVTAVADPPLSGETAAESSLWFQALGSWAERNAEVSGFDLDYGQSIYGFVAGADIGIRLGDDSTFLLGVLGGYVDSSLNFDQSSTSIKTDGATLGAYASFLHGGFFASILVKADVLTLDYSAPSVLVDTEDSADVASFGGRADIGFRFGGESLFVEPILSLDVISTKIDAFTIGGADVDPGTNDSIRGGAGLRLGVAAEMASVSVTGRVWDVFENENEVDISPAGPVLAISDDTLEGIYGEVAGQVDLDLSSSTVLFARGSLLFSDDVTKPSVSGGLSFFW